MALLEKFNTVVPEITVNNIARKYLNYRTHTMPHDFDCG